VRESARTIASLRSGPDTLTVAGAKDHERLGVDREHSRSRELTVATCGTSRRRLPAGTSSARSRKQRARTSIATLEGPRVDLLAAGFHRSLALDSGPSPHALSLTRSCAETRRRRARPVEDLLGVRQQSAHRPLTQGKENDQTSTQPRELWAARLLARQHSLPPLTS
jgi:hypothetical protein